MIAPKIINYKDTPERRIQDSIISYLRTREWMVLQTHGSLYQSGFPDLYAAHSRYGTRWIEVKNPECYSFTPAQLDTFPKLSAHNVGIWILGAGTESEYQKLFLKPNWHIYLMLLNQRSINGHGSCTDDSKV